MFITTISACLSVQTAFASDMADQEEAKYIPNQIIIKIKHTPAVACGLAADNQRVENIEGAAGKDAVASIIPGLNIKKVEKVFKGTPLEKEAITNKLNQLNSNVRLQTPKDALETKRLSRLLKAEEKRKALGLDKIYLIEVENQDILPIIENLKQNSSIEYAEPNYIYQI